MELANDFLQEKERIMSDNEIGMQRKITALQFLLSNMAEKYSIPLIYSEEYKAKNLEIVEVFESIAETIAQLKLSE